MKPILTTIFFALAAVTAHASTVIEYYNDADNLPFTQEEIYAFQMASSCAQYTEEQLVEIKPYTERRIAQQFEDLKEGKVVVAIATGADGKLLGASWVKPISDTELNLRQTNANLPAVYVAFAQSHFDKYETVKSLTLKLPEARVPLFMKIFGESNPVVIAPFKDDDDAFHGNIKFVYYSLARQ